MMKIGILVSGGGTNLQAVIDSIASGEIKNTEIAFVLSNNKNAYALERAKQAKIPAVALSPRDFENRELFHQELRNTIDSYGVDLLVLAGCLMILPEELIVRYKNRIINIHPSLIPSFCGKGYYGLTVHEKVLERGAKITGATVHYVDAGTDTGPILLQKAVEVMQDDTAETLQLRVMKEAEWKILPEAISLIAAGRVRVEDGKVLIV